MENACFPLWGMPQCRGKSTVLHALSCLTPAHGSYFPLLRMGTRISPDFTESPEFRFSALRDPSSAIGSFWPADHKGNLILRGSPGGILYSYILVLGFPDSWNKRSFYPLLWRPAPSLPFPSWPGEGWDSPHAHAAFLPIRFCSIRTEDSSPSFPGPFRDKKNPSAAFCRYLGIRHQTMKSSLQGHCVW